MADTSSARRTRPLLLASAGLSVLTMACGTFISGNLIAPPDCGDPDYDPDIYGPCMDGGTDAGDHEDGGTDGGTDGGQ